MRKFLSLVLVGGMLLNTIPLMAQEASQTVQIPQAPPVIDSLSALKAMGLTDKEILAVASGKYSELSSAEKLALVYKFEKVVDKTKSKLELEQRLHSTGHDASNGPLEVVGIISGFSTFFASFSTISKANGSIGAEAFNPRKYLTAKWFWGSIAMLAISVGSIYAIDQNTPYANGQLRELSSALDSYKILLNQVKLSLTK